MNASRPVKVAARAISVRLVNSSAPITDNNDDDYERSATEINLGYSFSDNAALGITMISDDMGMDADDTYTYVTLTITP